MLINVKILIPPSTGIQGGGQQGGAAPPPGSVGPTGPGPGCPWKKKTIKTKLITNKYLLFIVQI